MTQPFPATAGNGRVEAVLLFRSASAATCQLWTFPTLRFFLSYYAAPRIEQSGPVPMDVLADFVMRGLSDDTHRMDPVPLRPGDLVHMLIAYYGESLHAPGVGRATSPYDLENCVDSDAVTVAVDTSPNADLRALHPHLHVCTRLYESEYRRGDSLVSGLRLLGSAASPPTRRGARRLRGTTARYRI
jgi:hypothetical protein